MGEKCEYSFCQCQRIFNSLNSPEFLVLLVTYKSALLFLKGTLLVFQE